MWNNTQTKNSHLMLFFLQIWRVSWAGTASSFLHLELYLGNLALDVANGVCIGIRSLCYKNNIPLSLFCLKVIFSPMTESSIPLLSLKPFNSCWKFTLISVSCSWWKIGRNLDSKWKSQGNKYLLPKKATGEFVLFVVHKHRVCLWESAFKKEKPLNAGDSLAPIRWM